MSMIDEVMSGKGLEIKFILDFQQLKTLSLGKVVGVKYKGQHFLIKKRIGKVKKNER